MRPARRRARRKRKKLHEREGERSRDYNSPDTLFEARGPESGERQRESGVSISSG